MDPSRLVFVIGGPRCGTTLLSRLLHAHPSIYAGPEPHLMTPLAHLGYYRSVDKAPYDVIQTARGQRAFVDALPGGERDYLDGLRAFTDTLYGRLAAAHRAERVVDKTPAYALILPFLTKLYPSARYVVLTRHPFAMWVSYARTFFDDDWQMAHAHNPIVERYVPAIAHVLRTRPVASLHHLTYRQLVLEPETTLRSVYAALDLPFDPSTLTYADAEPPPPGLGDPTRVDRERGPVADGLDRWASQVASRPERRAMLERMVRRLPDEDLAAWGTPRAALWAPLERAAAGHTRLPIDRHHLERRVLVAARRAVAHPRLRRIVRGARFTLDVLLRD